MIRSIRICSILWIGLICGTYGPRLNAQASFGGRLFVIAAGISLHGDVRELLTSPKFAGTDAQYFGSFFKSQGLSRAVIVLTGKDATAARMKLELTKVLTGQAGPADEVYLFFSGEGLARPGSETGYILGYDSDRDRPESTALGLDTLTRLLDVSYARRVIIFSDLSRLGTPSRTNLINSRMQELAKRPRTAVFLACGPKQTSQESLSLGHGIYAYFLMKGLENTSVKTPDELEHYVASEVNKYTSGRQTPVAFGDLTAPMLWRAQ